MGKIKEYFKIAIRNLRTRSLRSWLTILGVVIGVFLIVGLLSLSEGIKATINEQLKGLGGEMIFIMPGEMSATGMMGMMMGGEKLEKADITAIEKTKDVDEVLTMSYSSSVMRYKDEGKTVFLGGLGGQPWEKGAEILKRFQGWSLNEGRWPISGKREVIIGIQIANEIFKEKVKVGTQTTIQGRRFEIVGILNSLGSKTDDSFVYLDMDLYQSITGGGKGSAQIAIVKIKEGASLNRVAENIKENLQETRKRKTGTDEADFSVITSDKITKITGDILAIIQFAIVIFASIAILVGGIGIMNTMFTSVRERTREIGIMKAIGAKNSTILIIFLIEASIIGLIGGLGGTILGAGMAKLIETYGQVHPVFYFSASISPALIAFGLFFSFFVGCLAGFLPAKRATMLKPVEALRRYE